MRLLGLVLAIIFMTLGAQGQTDEVKLLLSNSEGEAALTLIDEIDGPLSPELKHLKSLAIMQLEDPGSYLGFTEHESELYKSADSEGMAQIVNTYFVPLFKEPSDDGHLPAAVDLAMLMSIGQDSMSPSSLSLLKTAADGGYWPAEVLLFSVFCAGGYDQSINEIDFEATEMLARIRSIPTDEDSDPNFHHFAGFSDDDQTVNAALSTLAMSLAVGACSEKNYDLATEVFTELASRPGGQAQLVSGIRNVRNLLSENPSFAPDTRNTVVPDAEYSVRWGIFGIENKGLSNFGAVDVFSELVSGENVEPNEARARSALAEIRRLTAIEQGKENGFWETSLMTLWSSAKTALRSGKTEALQHGGQRSLSPVLRDAMVFAAQELHPVYPSYWRYETLAENFESGEFWPKDLGKAVSYYQKAAEIDYEYSTAEFKLGFLYSSPNNGITDGAKAIYWYTRAADKGGEASAFNLGLLYETGRIVNVSDSLALKWYEKAAELGSAKGMFKTGYFYDFGKGVPENDLTAYSWYLKSAELNSGAAQRNVGIMLMNGEGVSVDLVEAYKWLNLSAANGDANARETKNLLAQRMTRDQIRAAQQRSANWTPKQSVDEIQAVPGRIARREKIDPEFDQSIVTTIQQGLSELGYYGGRIDGIYGPQTTEAIRAFQTAYDLEVNPVPTANLALEVGAVLGMQFVLEDAPTQSGSEKESKGSGSGFLVSSTGHVVTNAHVVRGCDTIEVGGATFVEVLDVDDTVDLALLRASFVNSQNPLNLRSGRGIRLGDDLVVAGYPLSNILGDSLRITTGTVSSLSGIGKDRSTFQISAPIQPGNSGGPVLDVNGHVVGVVVSKLNAMLVASQVGDIPQNVNFAISLGSLKSFLDANNLDYEFSNKRNSKTNAQIAALAEDSTVQILCH